ncbi:MAG: DNA mismatch repair endonuclease MutL [Bacteroidales bacterium]|nr:DNA mismatch repair endonuclease MutL [Bacteroidales bacterium]
MLDNVIKVLPENVANQIAAGEVIHRPSSVVKELIENSLDAGAKNIKIIIRDAGKTLIQVIDDGIGMSEIDARLCFERHATSKVTTINDLYSISTYGFRGEALASIAAVAQVKLITKREIDNIGTCVEIHGSHFIEQKPYNCNKGTIVSVSNLFYNVPARRRFLKNETIEFKHIVDEFLRVSIPNPDVAFSLFHNDKEIYNLPQATTKQRLIHIFGNNYNSELLEVKIESPFVTISGYVGKPSASKKRGSHQFFFVNGRYIKHGLFYKAICKAYGSLLPENSQPIYFIFFTVDPKNIDVNIHPTKTEVLFSNEPTIAQLLELSVKKSIATGVTITSIDFDVEPILRNPIIYSENTESTNNNIPKLRYDKKEEWENFISIKSTSKIPENITDLSLNFSTNNEKLEYEKSSNFLYLKNQYIITNIKSGLIIIDQGKAHFRINYDSLKEKILTGNLYIEKLLLPYEIEITNEEFPIFNENLENFESIGIKFKKITTNKYLIESKPFFIDAKNLLPTIKETLENCTYYENFDFESIFEKFLISLSKSISIKNGQRLYYEEIDSLINTLFTTSNPEFTPDGKKIFYILSIEEIEKLLK